jgi:hypothetical protein
MIYELLTIGALIQPPLRFTHKYRGGVEIIWKDSQTITDYCPRFGVACVLEATPERCVIVFNVAYMLDYDKIMRHEMGHCNGWPPNHPQ